MVLIVAFSFALTKSSKKNLQKANELTIYSKALISEKLSIISDLQEAYIKSVFLSKPILNGSLFDTLNREIQINVLAKKTSKVVIFIAPDECLDCVKIYIDLLHKYFDNNYMIVRLINFGDTIVNESYPIWHYKNEDEYLKSIVELKQPLIALLQNDGILQYFFVPVNSDLLICNKYLSKLKETTTMELQ